MNNNNVEVQWMGKIPKTWSVERLRYLLEEINVKNIPIQTEQILSLLKDKGVLLYEEKGDVGNKSKTNLSEYKVAYPNTLIVNSMNVLIGAVGISKYKGCVSPVYYVFKENEKTDLRFINYIFNTREFQNELRKYANGIMEIRLRISSYDLLNRPIPLPEKKQQKRIADVLDDKCSEINKLISDIEKEISILEKYKKSVIYESVTKGFNSNIEMKNSGVEWIGNIPKKWETIATKYCFNIFNGSDPVTSGGDTPVYGSGKNSFKTCEEFKKGPAVLLGRKGTIDKPQWVEGNYWNVDTAFDVKEKGNYSLKLFYYSSICFDYGSYITQTALPSMTKDDYYKFKLPLMPKKEQDKITRYLDKKCLEIDKTISEKCRQLELLADYKKSLIYEYVTGKREVI